MSLAEWSSSSRTNLQCVSSSKCKESNQRLWRILKVPARKCAQFVITHRYCHGHPAAPVTTIFASLRNLLASDASHAFAVSVPWSARDRGRRRGVGGGLQVPAAVTIHSSPPKGRSKGGAAPPCHTLQGRWRKADSRRKPVSSTTFTFKQLAHFSCVSKTRPRCISVLPKSNVDAGK